MRELVLGPSRKTVQTSKREPAQGRLAHRNFEQERKTFLMIP